jgi:energy-converting hydrogenase Eha subunit G
VLNMLRAIWPALDALDWTSFLSYYQTFLIVRDEAYHWRDIAVLLGAAAAWWIAGLIVFMRRDVPAR